MKKIESSRSLSAWNQNSCVDGADNAARNENPEPEFRLDRLSGEELVSLAWTSVAYWANDELDIDKREALDAIEMSLVGTLNKDSVPVLTNEVSTILCELLESLDKTVVLQRLHRELLDGKTFEVKEEFRPDGIDYGIGGVVEEDDDELLLVGHYQLEDEEFEL